MNHPDRVNTERHKARKTVTPSGWITVYTAIIFMVGMLVYFAVR